MQLGVFIPIGNNGWLISTTSPQYKPSFDLNRTIVEKAERFGFDFALSMIKLHGFGGPSQFWDYNLEFFTLMAGLAAVTSRIQLFATCAVLTMPPPIAARMAVTIDSISHGRFGVNIISGWQRREYTQMGIWPGARALPAPLRLLRRIRHDHARAVGDRPLRLQGRLLPDGRLPLPAAADRADPDHLRRAERRRHAFAAHYADYNFCASGGVNEPHAVAPSVARLVAATPRDRPRLRRAGRCRWSSPTRPTRRRWRNGSTTRPAPISRRLASATRRPRTIRAATIRRRRPVAETLGTSCRPTRACWSAPMPVAACWTTWRRCRACAA